MRSLSIVALTLFVFSAQAEAKPWKYSLINGKVPTEYNPSAACVRVSWNKFSASGTCVAYEDGKSLVVTNNHLFSESHDSEGQLQRGEYPLAATVATLDGKKTFKATAIDGDRDADLALVVVDGELPVAQLAEADSTEGTRVWHKGIGSGGGEGRVLSIKPNLQPKLNFASDCSTQVGDSGAGVFDEQGRLVAVHCGRHGTEPSAAERGTPITPVRSLLRTKVKKTFPRLAARLGK